MECKTLERYEENGQMVTKPKKQFDTMDEAIIVAKKKNSEPHQIHKLVAYKCKTCFKYHIGRNGKEISDKVRKKAQQYFTKYPKPAPIKKPISLEGLKPLGWIDLSKIKY